MPDKADVASIEAIEQFRVSLLVYHEKAGQTLDEIADDVKRMRQWLQNEAQFNWKTEIKRLSRKVEQMHSEYYNARMSSFRGAATQEQQAYNKARRDLHEAEDKYKRVKKWTRDFDTIVGPVERKLDKARYMIAQDGPKSVALLSELVRSLSDYAEVRGMAMKSAPRATEEEEEG